MATMEIIQVSDIHLGVCRTLNNYLQRHIDIFKQIIQIAIEKKCPVLIPGDLLDSPKITHDEYNLVLWFLCELEKNCIPTIVSPGNHEHMYDDIYALNFLEHIPFKYVKIFNKPSVTTIGDIGIIALPWKDYSTDDIKQEVEQLLPSISKSKHKVVMLHECILGTTLDTGRILYKGTKIPYVPEITYWAIGDIHRCQATNVDNGWFAGSPLQIKYDDQERKGLLHVDLNNPTKPAFISLKCKPLRTISSIEQITDDAYYQLVGNFEEILKAGNNPMIVRTDLSSEICNPIVDFKRIDIIEGLTEFLASKDINEQQQKYALNWVEESLKS